MKLIIQNNRIAATATDAYTGPDEYITVPEDFDVTRLGEYRYENGALVLVVEKRTALNAEYERRMQGIAAGYPPSERESWPVQTSEAYTLLADSTASTPWIDAAASARGLDRIELAQRIVAKDAQYRVFSGTLSGVRQRIEDAIDAAGGDAQALQAIDVTAGWPAGAD